MSVCGFVHACAHKDQKRCQIPWNCSSGKFQTQDFSKNSPGSSLSSHLSPGRGLNFQYSFKTLDMHFNYLQNRDEGLEG